MPQLLLSKNKANLGPFLTLEDVSDRQLHLVALFVAAKGIFVSPIVARSQEYAALELAHVDDTVVHRIQPTPGQAGRYVADRNARILMRHQSAGSAVWDFETIGLSGVLPL